MTFNSFSFILVFLPAFIAGYFLANRISVLAGKVVLILAGIVFYAYSGVVSSAIFAISIVFNFTSARLIHKAKDDRTKPILAGTIAVNIGLLFFFKYSSFVGFDLIFPVGISFFTFQQIMYIVSVYRKETYSVGLVDYLTYILYFPKLLMGPLVEPKELTDQLSDESKKHVNCENMACGIRIFGLGLFKKMVLADTFARAVDWGFVNTDIATPADLILVMLFYTFEIYFDFSGYSDMAVGVSAMLNIDLPMNFDSPYKALSIRDFWKRWHVSLTGFLTKYVYFPLGGSRKGTIRTYINIMIVFLISGIWHGSNLTFVLWGLLHGLLQVLERATDRIYGKILRVIRWAYTFAAVNILWLLFRVESIGKWLGMIKKMLRIRGINVNSVSDGLFNSFRMPENTMIFDALRLTGISSRIPQMPMIMFIIAAFAICLIPNNNYRNMRKLSAVNAVIVAIAFIWGFMCLGSESVFVYYNF